MAFSKRTLVLLAFSICAVGVFAVANDSAQRAKQLTTDGLFKRDPVFWPESGDLLYTVESDTTSRMKIVRQNLKSGEIKSFDDRADGDRELAASADGSVYAYNSVSGLSSRITVVDKKRGRTTTIPNMGLANWNNWPTVSPDGTRVVFTEGAAILYSYDVTTAKGKESVKRISPKHAVTISDYWPRFTPDGKQLVFVSNRDEDFEIYIMNADGSEPKRLTTSPGIDMHPAVSPDGRRIAFTSNRDGNYEIYVMNIDGSQQRRLTDNPERDDFCCWHPNGREIVFVSEREGEHDLYQLEVDRAVALGEAEKR